MGHTLPEIKKTPNRRLGVEQLLKCYLKGMCVGRHLGGGKGIASPVLKKSQPIECNFVFLQNMFPFKFSGFPTSTKQDHLLPIKATCYGYMIQFSTLKYISHLKSSFLQKITSVRC